MKSYTSYLAESKKTFEFKIKIAGRCDNDLMEKVKTAMNTFNVLNISKPKSLPVAEYAEFPQMGPIEVKLVEVELEYPTTPSQLGQLIHQRTGLHSSCVHVRTKLEDLQFSSETVKAREKPALETEELESVDGAQEVVGQARRDSLLKELEARTYEFAAKTEADGKTTNELPTNNTSPVGSKQNKIPSPVKGKK